MTLHVTSQLRGWKSPFVALPQMSSMACLTSGLAEAGGELRFAADSLPLAEWLHGPVVTLAISRLAHSAAGLGLVQAAADGMMTGQEDAHKEVKCRQAVRSVAAYESKTCIKAQVRGPSKHSTVRHSLSERSQIRGGGVPAHHSVECLTAMDQLHVSLCKAILHR